jgi:hypothetical protein
MTSEAPKDVRFCTYCRSPKPAATFVEVKDRTGRLRNRKCADCNGMKKKPKEVRDAVAEKRRSEAKEAEARRMQEITLRRQGKAYTKSQDEYLRKRFGD